MPVISLATYTNSHVDDMLPIARPNSSNAYHVQAGGIAGLAGRGQLSADYSAGATIINVRGMPKNMGSYQGWLVIDPYTNECEIRRIEGITDNQLTIRALSYNHNIDDSVIFTDAQTIHVGWFGAKGDGTTDDSTAINRALAQATILGYDQGIVGRVKVIFQPGAAYRITEPINLCNMVGVALDGGSPVMGAVIRGEVGATKAMIEMIGAQNCSISNLQIYGHSSNTPAIGVFASRSTVNPNGTQLFFDRVYFSGYFSKTPFYSVENENIHWNQCVWLTQVSAGLLAEVVISRSNVLSITPVNATLMGGGNACTLILFDSCALTNSSGSSGRGLYLWDAAGDVTIRHTYMTSYSVPTIEIRGGANLFMDGMAFEGTPDNTVKVTYDAAAFGNVSRLKIRNSGWGSPTGYALLSDTNALLRDCTIQDSPTNYPVKVWQLENCDFSGLAHYDFTARAITIDGGYSAQCVFKLGPADTISYINGATSAGDTVINNVTSFSEFLQAPGLKVGADATAATVTKILTASQTWNPGTISHGGAAIVAATLTGVTMDGNWVCQASYTGIVSGGDVWILNAYADSDSVRVVLQNWCGADRTPTGTLRVVAMKVT